MGLSYILKQQWCLSVRAVLGNFFSVTACSCGVLCRRGGGPGKLRNFLIWEFRSLWQLLPNWQLRRPEPRWPKSSIKDLNRDSQYPVQTSRRTWNEVPRKKTRRWGLETRSSKRKPVIRVLKRGCTLLFTNTEFFFFKLILKIKLFLWGLNLDPIHVHSFTRGVSDPKSHLLPVLWKNRSGQPLRGAGRDATGGWSGVATSCPHSLVTKAWKSLVVSLR